MELPPYYPRSSIDSHKRAAEAIELEPSLVDAAKQFCRQQNISLYELFLAVFKLFLHRYTGQEDIVVGGVRTSHISNQYQASLPNLFWPVALRTYIEGELTVSELLKRIHQTVENALEDQDYSQTAPTQKPIQDESLNQGPIPQMMLVLCETPTPLTALPIAESNLEAIRTFSRECDILVIATEKKEPLELLFDYNAMLFESSAVQCFLENFRILLSGMVSDSEQPLYHTPMLSTRECQQLLVEWNNTRADYPRNQSIPQLFQAQVEKTPDAAAVSFGSKTLTYRELNRNANQLAHYLREIGVDSNALVGICIEPSLELIVGLLGVLKANSVYVPLDPNYPQERLAFMVEDSQVQVILTLDSLKDEIPSQQTPLVCLDKDKDAIEEKSTANPHPASKSNDLAYVIYTSGSTGRPKAVLGTVRGVINRLQWGWEMMPFGADEVCCQKTSINFVDHVAEIFAPLLKGIPLIVIPDDMRGNILELMNLLGDQKVTRIVLVPSLLKTILENASPDLDLFKNLRYVICSGEALPLSLAKTFHQRIRSARLFNLYGSSEVAADVTYFDVKWPLKDDAKTTSKDTKEPANTTIPIGKPMSNTQIYILDKYGGLLPPGVIGELYVSGDGLAKGYLKQPELTQKAFVQNPFNQNEITRKKDKRLFRTGDLGRWLPDGNIEFHGRIDHQVKLRGFRIELGEIEAVLSQHEGVREAVVLLYEGQENPFLAAYITKAEATSTEERILISELREWLQKRLPDYMVPASFTVLEKLPLTPNGKTDRRSLPDPALITRKREQSHKTPENLLERKLIEIWEHVLKIDFIGVDDNFFELGGNSLAAVKVLNQVGQTFHKKLPPVTLYQAPTVADFAAILDQENFKAEWRMIEPIQTDGYRFPFIFLGPIEHARELTRLLGPDQPFLRLNVLGFQHEPSFPIKLGDMAKQACEEIRTIQPQGPYFFGAFCNNAVLAIEIARFFQADKQRIAFMGIFDLFWRRESRFLGLERQYQNLTQFGFQYFSDKVKARIQSYKKRQMVDRLRQKCEQCQRNGEPAPHEAADILLFEKIDAAFDNSEIKPYEGRITHFMASEWRVSYSPLLNQIATDGVEVHIIDGCHGNLFVEPQVGQLVQKLKACLDRERSESS